MKFSTAPAPHWRLADGVPVIMRQVLYALTPALMMYIWFFGIGVLLNCLIATAAALATEAVALKLRHRSQKLFLTDYSVVVAAILLALALPPLTPWWVTVIGVVFAIGFAKHLYGGLGYNIFNPAMAGYVVLLISFPEEMTRWLPPEIGDIDYQPLSWLQSAQYTLTGSLPESLTMDALTRATPLDTMKTELGLMLTVSEIRNNPLFGDFGGRGWEWINNVIALGGFWLLYKNVIRWQIPVSMLAGLIGMALLFYIIDPATHASPGFHLFSGGTMLCAFFIATDPVTAPGTVRGRIIYGASIGILTYVIRAWGSYPDGIAFAILLMNMAVPLIDRLTRPRIYGHQK